MPCPLAAHTPRKIYHCSLASPPFVPHLDTRQGWLYWPSSSASKPTVLRANDGYKVVVRNHQLFVIWGGSDIKMFDSNSYKSASVADAIFNPDILNGAYTWSDMDVEASGLRVWLAGGTGLTVGTYNAGTGTWPFQVYTRIASLVP